MAAITIRRDLAVICNDDRQLKWIVEVVGVAGM
jgi:hypothetical protein